MALNPKAPKGKKYHNQRGTILFGFGDRVNARRRRLFNLADANTMEIGTSLDGPTDPRGSVV